MKENSIEEDIKLLEEFSNENVLYGSTVGMTLEKYKDLQLSTEHILSDYKRILKENKEYYKQLDLDYTEKNFIPVQEVKRKIEKLQSELKHIGCGNSDCNKCFTKYRGSNFVYCYAYHQIKVLQELLESEE